MGKVLKCCNNDDIVTLKAEDNADAMTFMFENQSQDRISDFELKLMDIDSEHLGIPDTEYKCQIKMPASEFQRICRDLAILGDTVLRTLRRSTASPTPSRAAAASRGRGQCLPAPVRIRSSPRVPRGSAPVGGAAARRHFAAARRAQLLGSYRAGSSTWRGGSR